MTRMAFGLSIAPKFMDMIVQYITQGFSGVDNYADDLLTPAHDAEDVAAEMLQYGLPTKDHEDHQRTTPQLAHAHEE